MKIESQKVDGGVVVRVLESRLGADKATSFKETLGRFIESGDRLIVLDLSHVEFIDSSGLGAALSVLKRLGKEGELIVCGATEPVIGMFKLTRMDRVFRMHKTVEDALTTLVE
jgi:anti-sigma B factor antagonist